jgi:hypothetical protein
LLHNSFWAQSHKYWLTPVTATRNTRCYRRWEQVPAHSKAFSVCQQIYIHTHIHGNEETYLCWYSRSFKSREKLYRSTSNSACLRHSIRNSIWKTQEVQERTNSPIFLTLFKDKASVAFFNYGQIRTLVSMFISTTMVTVVK